MIPSAGKSSGYKALVPVIESLAHRGAWNLWEKKVGQSEPVGRNSPSAVAISPQCWKNPCIKGPGEGTREGLSRELREAKYPLRPTLLNFTGGEA